MESTGRPDAANLLRIGERAGAAPFVNYPTTRWWYPPAVGLWCAAMLAVLLYRPSPALTIGTVLALVCVEGVAVGLYRQRRGTMPALNRTPTELRPVFVRYAVGVTVVIAIVTACVLLLPHWAAVATTFVAVTVGIAAYERHYAIVAAAIRVRLA